MARPDRIYVGSREVKRVVRDGSVIWKYMAKYVGYTGYSTILHSDDGLVWTRSSASSSGSIGEIRLLCGKYVAVAQSGGIRYSDDGVTFSDSTGSVGQPFAVCYGGGKFVAVGSDEAWLYSQDAANWVQASAFPSMSPRKVIWDGVRFVAMYTSSIAVSYDGISWESVSQTPTEKAFGTRGIAMLGGTVVCCDDGNNGKLYRTTPDPSPAAGSDDSYKAWTRIDSASAAYGVTYLCLTAGNGRFVAAGRNGVSSSADGETWTTAELSGTWRSVLWDGSLYRLYGENKKTATSPDGITWTLGSDVTIPTSTTAVYSVCCRN